MTKELSMTIPQEFAEIASVLQLDAQLLGDYSVEAVNGRHLQSVLGSTKDHTNWAKKQIERLRLRQGVDYEILSNLSSPSGASSKSRSQVVQTYCFPIGVAKDIALVAHTPEGDMVRAYFLHMEKVAQGAYRGSLPATLPEGASSTEKALREYDFTVACMSRSIETLWGKGYAQKMAATVALDVDARHGTQISRLIPAPTAMPGQKEEVDISRGEHLLRQTVGSKEINVSQFKDMFFLKSTTPLNETLVALGYQTVLRAPGARSISGYQLVPGKERYATQIPLSGGNLAGQFKIAAWILNSFSDAEKEKIKAYLVEHYKKTSFNQP